MKKICYFSLLLLTLLPTSLLASEWRNGISLYGEEHLKYELGKPYEHADPNAKKGGQVTLASFGAFTKFNPVSMTGRAAPDLSLVFETLMDTSADIEEPFTQYGLLADKVKLADDHMSIQYHINPNAYFSDGVKVTAKDILFSFELIKSTGYNPAIQNYLKDIKSISKIDNETVKVEFKNYNQELPLATGQVYILPKHIYGTEGKNFDKDFDNVIPIGSGPYKVKKFDKSKFITYERDKKYWGRKLPVNVGRYNFDKITFKLFTDMTALRESLMAGIIDADMVMVARDWVKYFNGEKIDNNYLVKKVFPSQRVASMQGYAFNLRNPIFKEIRVRRVIAALMNFEFLNNNLFYNQYQRLTDYFDNNKEMMVRGASEGSEKATLIKLQEKYGKEYVPDIAINQAPKVLGYDYNNQPIPMQNRIKAANIILEKLGWKYDSKNKVRIKDGLKLQFEFIITDSNWIRIVNSYIQTLRKVGIKARYRLVQPAEYMQKVMKYDYDIIVAVFGSSLSPGNELLSYWSSKSADIQGESNLCGVKNPAIDEVLNKLVASKTRKELIQYVHILDRILCANYYVVPHWFLDRDRFLYWNKFSSPKKNAGKNYIITNFKNWWWYDPEKKKKLNEYMKSGSELPY
jgi:microcin C transport system substrate-binding protein